MDADAIAELLGLPQESRLGRRVTKAMFSEQASRNAADRKLIGRSLESLSWVAALKPGNCGVAGYSDDQREYNEIQVLRLEVRGQGGTDRLARLVHRSVPYPVVLFTIDEVVTMSTAHLRRSNAAGESFVVEGEVEAAVLPGCESPWWRAASAELTIAAQAPPHLLALYSNWNGALIAIRAAARTGVYRRTTSDGAAVVQREALAECERLEVEMDSIRATARATPQRSRQVSLTARLRELERAHAEALARV